MRIKDPVAERLPVGRLIETGHVAAVVALAAITMLVVLPRAAEGGGFVFAGEANGINVITHPIGYTGASGNISVSVCIDPTSANAADMAISVQNIVSTFNAMTPVQGNVVIPSPDLAFNEVDFESVALHEVGHCIGLAHPNAATESGLPIAERNYTKATDGVNNVFNLGVGTDAVKGSADDIRGDDVNLHWFRMTNNNPFTIAGTVDSTTYARDTGMLPGGDSFAANADRMVAGLLGAGSTEAVMQQGSFSDEEQRMLNHDDVATLRYARTGLDSIAGTADDYTVTLTYAGMTTACDLVLDFDNTETGLAVCQTLGTFLTADDVAITGADAFFNTGSNWFFNDELSGVCPTNDETFANQTVTGPITLQAQQTVTLGTNLTVNGGPGLVDVRASQTIVVLEGTSFSGQVSLQILPNPCG